LAVASPMPLEAPVITTSLDAIPRPSHSCGAGCEFSCARQIVA
jgi:hypothetical protein